MGFISSFIRNLTKKTLEGGYRKDFTKQSTIQQAVDKGRIVKVENLKSSRWGKTNSSGDLYDSSHSGMDYSKLKEQEVASTAVEDVIYDPKTEELKVKYRNGSTYYSFPGVPEETFTEFMDAPSKGKYLAYVIMPKYSRSLNA